MPVVFSGSVPFHAYRARLKRIVARERPQAIYVHHEPYGVATFQAFLASRQFADIPIGFYSAQNILKRYPWPISRFERYVYARASFAFPVSANVAAVLRRKGYRGGYAVLPLGIDTGLYRPDPAELSHNGAEHPLTVGYVGSHGVDLLTEQERNPPSYTVDSAGVYHFRNAANTCGDCWNKMPSLVTCHESILSP